MTTTGRNIVLGITGSISAYKAADLASEMTKAGHVVNCVLTSNAAHFVSPLVLGTLTRRHVTRDLNDEEPGRPGHIALADDADLVLVAPATANLIANHAQGLAPDALTSLLLATRAPVLIAPAMNGRMWEHPATQANVALLQSRGVHFVGPASGMLACGYEGVGRLSPVEEILARVDGLLSS